jgi:3-hydroxyisobutyrate dehydrogenase-like beta-hydroxyacid dehydrogenase
VTRFGLLGFGEAASALASGLTLAPGDEIAAFDPALRTDPVRARAAVDAGVTVLDDVSLLATCDLVLSLVTPAVALAVARGYAPHAPAGQHYLEANSTAPPVKLAIAAELEPRGVHVTDGVLTGGGIQLDGVGIPISLAGRDAELVAGLLVGVGLKAAVIGEEVGQAAAMKMLRGVVIKGLEALSVEALTAARAYGLDDVVVDSLSETLDRWDIRDFVEMLVRSHTMHCGRRSVEVRMIRETVAGTGLEPLMSAAAQELFERSAAANLLLPGGDHPRGLHDSVGVLVDALIDHDPARGAGGGEHT